MTVRDQAKFCSVDGCGKAARTRGYCLAHYGRFYRHGDPLGAGGRTPKGEPERYFCEVVLAYDGDDCLPWPYAGDGKGYGVMNVDGKVTYIHRRVCERAHGPAPTPSHKATHSCGNGDKACCTKRHLRWGTQKENMADTIIHGTAPRGERHGCAKLTEADVRAIRSLKGTAFQRDIAAKFGISRTSVSVIQSRKNWGWLDAG